MELLNGGEPYSAGTISQTVDQNKSDDNQQRRGNRNEKQASERRFASHPLVAPLQ